MHRARFIFNLSLLSGFVNIFNKFIFFLKLIVDLHNINLHLFPYVSGNMNNFSESALYKTVEIYEYHSKTCIIQLMRSRCKFTQLFAAAAKSTSFKPQYFLKNKKAQQIYTLLRNKSLTLQITTTLP